MNEREYQEEENEKMESGRVRYNREMREKERERE